MREESASMVASQPEVSPADPAAVCAILAYCGGDAPGSTTEQLLNAHREDPVAFEQSLFDNVLIRMLTAPHHRPGATAGMLRELAVAVARVRSSATGASIRDRVVEWLLEINGGSSCGARDTGVRWRTCILLASLLQPPTTAVRVCTTESEGRVLPSQLLTSVGEYFLCHVRDRSADVRLAAVEGLEAIKLRIAGADQAVAERATQDCDAHVRAASVRAVVTWCDKVPEDVIAHARWDCAPRARRALLRALEPKIKSGSTEWKSVWPAVVLCFLGDRSFGIRTMATRCVQAGTESSWREPLLSEGKLAEEMASHLAEAASTLLQRDPDNSRLKEQLSPEDALLAVSGSSKSSASAAILARVAVAATAGSADAVDAAAVVPALMAVLSRGSAQEIRQMLLTALAAEVPPSTAARSELVKAATAVILRAPVADTAQVLLGRGAFSSKILGGAGEAPPHNLVLAMMLLRRVASYSASSPGQARHTASSHEAWFSKVALAAIRAVGQQLEKAEQVLAEREEDAMDVREFHRQHRAQRSAQSTENRKDAERAARAAEAAASAAKTERDECNLRMVLAASAWMQHSRMAASEQAQALLDGVLRPALANSNDQAYTTPVAAVMGIAIHASKSQAAALVHWPFFQGLLDVQIKRLRQPASSAGNEGSPLCVAARYAEIAVLFLSDAVLLHSSEIGEEWIGEALVVFAKAISAVDEGANNVFGLMDLMQHLAHLRAVICDRTCCLAMMGKLHGCIVPAQWLLARFLVDVCGPGINKVVHPDDATTRTTYAVAGGRMLRFLAMLPLTSFAHAELLVSATESFFAARMWTEMPQGRGSRTRASPAVRVIRLVCARLRIASAAISAATGGCPKEHDTDKSVASMPECALYVKMQVRALRAVAAALLAAPAVHTYMLRDAFAAGILTSAAGGPSFEWAGEDSAELASAAVALLGRDWMPATTAKSVEVLLSEVRSGECAADAGQVWAQEAVERAADIRLDFVSIGLLSTGTGSGAAPCTSTSGNRCLVSTPPHAPPPLAGAIVGSALQRFQTAKASKLEWHLDNLATGEAMRVPDGEAITIGRHPLCDIVIESLMVSGNHCSVTSVDGRLEIQDLGGRNGTYLNDRLLSLGFSGVKLSAGDVIAIAGQLGPRFQIKRCFVADADLAETSQHPEHIGAEEARAPESVYEQQEEFSPESESRAENEVSRAHEEEDDRVEEQENEIRDEEQENEIRDEEQEAEEHHNDDDKGAEESASPAEDVKPEEQDTSLRLQREPLAQADPQDENWSPITTGTCRENPSVTPAKTALPPRFRSKRRPTIQEEEMLGQVVMQPAKKSKQMDFSTEDALPSDQHTKDVSTSGPAMLASADEVHSQASGAPADEDHVAVKVLAALQDGRPCLIDLGTGNASWLPSEGAVTIGRMGDCEVVVREPSISSRHCILLIRGGEVEVEDVSSNGTYVNETRVPKGYALPQQISLRHGDRLTLASYDGPSFLFLASAELRPDEDFN